MSASSSTVDEVVVRLGRKIAGARVERGMSQADVAALAGTSPSRISALEKGRERARIDTLARVAQAVGLEVTLRDVAA